MRPLFFWGTLLMLGALAARGEPRTFSSGAARVSLLELFTSEGCSSCPPADRWLAALRDDPRLWREFVPVAFHVDYWNRLGWPDRFSNAEFTQREYRYASAWRSDSVYTPCFVRDGAEWRGRHELARDTVAPAGVLTATYDGAVVRADFVPASPSPDPGGYEVHAALLGGGIASKVTAGENRGDVLRHEFVTLRLATGEPGAAIALPRATVPGVLRYALAVWITPRSEPQPLQATGGWLD